MASETKVIYAHVGMGEEKPNLSIKYPHYVKDIRRLEKLDVYRVLTLYGVTDPCLQHSIKKLLCCGGRGVKSVQQDVQEAIDTLHRFIEMRGEE